MDSGYPNAVTLPVWNRFYKKQISGGSFWMHTVCSLEGRAHVAQYTHRVLHLPGRRPSRAIATPAAKSGVPTKGILAIRPTGIFTETSVSICPWNIWDRSHAERENSPA